MGGAPARGSRPPPPGPSGWGSGASLRRAHRVIHTGRAAEPPHGITLRNHFGEPPRPAAIDPTRRGPGVVSLSRAIYDGGDASSGGAGAAGPSPATRSRPARAGVVRMAAHP